MAMRLRRGEARDAAAAGDICYRAFKAIAEAHGFAPDFRSVERATATVGGLIGHQGFFDLIAEADGRIVGSNFLDERGQISGVGPITVDPELQNDGAGRALMDAVLQRAREGRFAGVRLVQAGYHSRSLALYLKLGFEARAQLACLQGPAIGQALPGLTVRAASASDLAACNGLCLRTHGHERSAELAEAVGQGAARVVERAGRITGYATAIAFFGHAVGESNDDLMALVGAAEGFGGPGFLVPTGNGALLRWCLAGGLQITQTMTLMSIGLYNEPEGAWIPSVLY